VRFGLPDEFVGVEEPESRFKEVGSCKHCYGSTDIVPLFISKSTTGLRILLVVLDGSSRGDQGRLRRLQRKVRR
jgi:hypothetical protein